MCAVLGTELEVSSGVEQTMSENDLLSEPGSKYHGDERHAFLIFGVKMAFWPNTTLKILNKLIK